jgi:hypothetical protein
VRKIEILSEMKFAVSTILSERTLAMTLLVGIAIRLVLMPIAAHPYDIYIWYKVSTEIINNGPFSIQAFPPLWYHYMMIPIAYIYNYLSGALSQCAIPMASLPSDLNFYPSYNIQFVPGLLFNFLVKLPFLLSDSLICLMLYKIVLEITGQKNLAQKGALFWFLNPFVIWISAGWGMWDTLPALFSLITCYYIVKKRMIVAALSLSVAVAFKVYPLLFLIPIGIYLWRTNSFQTRGRDLSIFLRSFIVSTSLLLALSIGSIPKLLGYFYPISTTANAINNAIVSPVGFGLSYWSVSLLNRLFNTSYSDSLQLAIYIISPVMVILAFAHISRKMRRTEFGNPLLELSIAMILIVLALFLSYRIIEEQWLVWVLPFIVITCSGGKLRWFFYWGISSLALVYSLLNCPFPFYFLPLTPWATNSLLAIVHTLWVLEPVRILGLITIGCLFSAIIVLIVSKLINILNQHKLY